ncbi:beta ketoadipyl CoA thiolase, th1, partial [Cladochytrium tenue]
MSLSGESGGEDTRHSSEEPPWDDGERHDGSSGSGDNEVFGGGGGGAGEEAEAGAEEGEEELGAMHVDNDAVLQESSFAAEQEPGDPPLAKEVRLHHGGEDEEEEEEELEGGDAGTAAPAPAAVAASAGGGGEDTTLFGDLSAYTERLSAALAGLGGSTEHTIGGDIDRLRGFVQDEQSYVYTQALLRRLAARAAAGKASGRLVQRVATEVDELLGITSSSQPFSEALRFSGKPTTDLVASILKITNGEVQASDVLQLKSTYSGQNPPSVEYIRTPAFFDALLNDIFKSPVAPNLMSEKMWLLAYASAVVEAPDGTIDKSEVETTAHFLQELKTLISGLNPSMDMKEVFLDLLDLSKSPICCTAELNWIRTMVTDPTFYESNLLLGGSEAPPLFDLLNEIAIASPLQRSAVLEIYAENLERAYDT